MAAAHYCICQVCHQRFNRDIEPFVEVSPKRYAHKICVEQGVEAHEKEMADKKALEDYIMQIFNEKFVNARIKKQIKDFMTEYNYSYSGILKTLKWWYEVKGNKVDTAMGGIGIVPFVYKDACDYFYALYLANLINEDKKDNDFKMKQRVVEIVSPRTVIKQPKLFDLGEDVINGI